MPNGAAGSRSGGGAYGEERFFASLTEQPFGLGEEEADFKTRILQLFMTCNDKRRYKMLLIDVSKICRKQASIDEIGGY